VDKVDFMVELEAEFLVECVKFGNVICLTTFPECPYYLSAVIVTFEDINSAQSCAEVMDGRSFADDFIKVQALGNWGNGEINPSTVHIGEQGGGGGGDAVGDEEELDDFFSSVLES
jgi:hypothetical protein